MKKLLIVFLVFLLHLSCLAQDRIKFDYDSAGNQVRRYVCFDCQDRTEPPKEIANLLEEDLLKFSPSDVISYYPNPVKEELYLKWELINENKVSSIDIYSINGQLVKTYKSLNTNNSKNIPFQEHPAGTYLVLLNYTSGEHKSITILKQ